GGHRRQQPTGAMRARLRCHPVPLPRTPLAAAYVCCARKGGFRGGHLRGRFLRQDPGMEIPKPTDADREWFRSVVPDDPRVEVKPMFGNLGAFVNGNMFMGLFGSAVGVR